MAARLQAVAQPNAVVISPSTRELVGELFTYRDLGALPLKGFAEPIHAFEVLTATGVESRFEALRQGRQSPLVGRRAEFETLSSEWRRAATGEGRVVVLSGEAGVGKSRLTVALTERIASESHLRLRYYCSRHQQSSPFQPFITQIAHAAKIVRDDSPASKLEKLAQVLIPGPSPEEDLLLVADLLSVPLGERGSRLDALHLAYAARR